MKSNSFLLRQLWLHQEDFRWIALVWGAAFLILAAIEAIVCPLLSEEGAIIPIASLLGLVIGPILMAVFGVVRFTTEFGIGLQMGATRRQMVAAELWLCLCQNVEIAPISVIGFSLWQACFPPGDEACSISISIILSNSSLYKVFLFIKVFTSLFVCSYSTVFACEMKVKRIILLSLNIEEESCILQGRVLNETLWIEGEMACSGSGMKIKRRMRPCHRILRRLHTKKQKKSIIRFFRRRSKMNR